MAIFFIFLTLAVLFALLNLTNRGLEAMQHTNIRGILTVTAVGGLGWLMFLALKAHQDFFEEWHLVPPRFIIVIGVPLLLIISLFFMKRFGEFARGISPVRTMQFQTFRLFVEIVLWQLAVSGTLHKRMTFEGHNFDILIGLTAIPVAYMVFQKKKWPLNVAVIWNYVGIILLTAVAVTGILSAPTPFQVFTEKPANTIIVEVPYIWLPGLLVPMGYFLHILSLKQLKGLKESQQ